LWQETYGLCHDVSLTKPSVPKHGQFTVQSPSDTEVMQTLNSVVLHLARLFWGLGCCLGTPGVALLYLPCKK